MRSEKNCRLDCNVRQILRSEQMESSLQVIYTNPQKCTKSIYRRNKTRELVKRKKEHRRNGIDREFDFLFFRKIIARSSPNVWVSEAALKINKIKKWHAVDIHAKTMTLHREQWNGIEARSRQIRARKRVWIRIVLLLARDCKRNGRFLLFALSFFCFFAFSAALA